MLHLDNLQKRCADDAARHERGVKLSGLEIREYLLRPDAHVQGFVCDQANH